VLAGGCRRPHPACLNSIRPLILTKLGTNTPCPLQIRAVDAVHQGPIPAEPVLEVADPPTQPVRHFISRQNPRVCSVAWRARPGWPLRGIATCGTPRVCSSSSTAASP
jgi:hypothetical protein